MQSQPVSPKPASQLADPICSLPEDFLNSRSDLDPLHGSWLLELPSLTPCSWRRRSTVDLFYPCKSSSACLCSVVESGWSDCCVSLAFSPGSNDRRHTLPSTNLPERHTRYKTANGVRHQCSHLLARNLGRHSTNFGDPKSRHPVIFWTRAPRNITAAGLGLNFQDGVSSRVP